MYNSTRIFAGLLATSVLLIACEADRVQMVMDMRDDMTTGM